MQIYLVGGAVRDKLLGYPVYDKDWVVVGATVQTMLDSGYTQVGRGFPVFLHPDSKEEYALARTERKTGPGYKGFEVHAAPDVTLEQDLARRDLTINAMAESESGQLIDPFNGQADVAAGVLRHVSPAFAEDPVRILRVARFMARYTRNTVGQDFTLATDTLEMMKNMVDSGETDNLVAERSWQEMHKALREDQPQRFFETLDQCHAVHSVFNGNAEQLARSLSALKYACDISDDAVVRYAAFCSSLSAEQVKALTQQLKCPKEYAELSRLVIEQLDAYRQVSQLPPPQSLAILKAVDAYRKPERFDDFLRASEASVRAQPNQADKPHPQREYLQSIYHATVVITAKDMTRVRLEGKALAEEIDRHRAAAIVKIKRTYRWSYFNVKV